MCAFRLDVWAQVGSIHIHEVSTLPLNTQAEQHEHEAVCKVPVGLICQRAFGLITSLIGGFVIDFKLFLILVVQPLFRRLVTLRPVICCANSIPSRDVVVGQRLPANVNSSTPEPYRSHGMYTQ
jgi:hypothetical protein